MNRPEGFKNPYSIRHHKIQPHEVDIFESGADAILAAASQVFENQRDGERFEAITIPAKSRVFVIVTPMEDK